MKIYNKIKMFNIFNNDNYSAKKELTPNLTLKAWSCKYFRISKIGVNITMRYHITLFSCKKLYL